MISINQSTKSIYTKQSINQSVNQCVDLPSRRRSWCRVFAVGWWGRCCLSTPRPRRLDAPAGSCPLCTQRTSRARARSGAPWCSSAPWNGHQWCRRYILVLVINILWLIRISCFTGVIHLHALSFSYLKEKSSPGLVNSIERVKYFKLNSEILM